MFLQGPANIVSRADALDIGQGRVFIDSPAGITTGLRTPKGALRLAQLWAGLNVSADGNTEAYVLSGEIRSGAQLRAQEGEQLAS